MQLILALEPDARQAALLTRVVSAGLGADLQIVDSRDAAIAAITARVPDVILLTALMSPRDEEELIAHLRTRDGIEHVQTHTIPMLAEAAPEERPEGGLLGRLRRKKAPGPIAGCDPELFAGELREYLQRAADIRSMRDAAAAALAPEAAGAVPSGADAERERLLREAQEAEQRAAEAEARRREEAQRRRELEEAAARELAAREAAEAVARAREEERIRLEEEQHRLEAERAAERERLMREAELAAQRAHEAERQRLDEERRRRDAEEVAERERLMKEAQLAADRAREAERQRFEDERRRREAEEAAERERLLLEARSAADRARQAELRRLQEEQSRRDAEEAAERERMLRDAAAAAEHAREEERMRLEEEQRREEERAAAERAQLRQELEAAAARAQAAEQHRQQEEQRRRAAEDAARRERQLREVEAEEARTRKRTRAATAPKPERSPQPTVAGLPADAPVAAHTRPPVVTRGVVSDEPFADFRACISGAAPDSILRLMPVERFARSSSSRQKPAEAAPADDVHGLIRGLKLPEPIAGFEYPRRCRIRRVRVLSGPDEPQLETSGPVIVSRRVLGELRQPR